VRTTVTLDPDTAALVRKRMKERGVSFKQAVNDLIRDGVPRSAAKFQTPTFDMGVPRVNLDKALQLAAELEDEEIIRKMRRGA
jgi:hypothetical protein